MSAGGGRRVTVRVPPYHVRSVQLGPSKQLWSDANNTCICQCSTHCLHCLPCCHAALSAPSTTAPRGSHTPCHRLSIRTTPCYSVCTVLLRPSLPLLLLLLLSSSTGASLQ